MRFCKECNNMLYANENKEEKLLRFHCKNCNYIEPVDTSDQKTNRVYTNEIKLGQSAIKIDPCIVNDPTYSRTKNVSCPVCYHNEAIFFQNPNSLDTGMKLVFVCSNKKNGVYCGKWWYNEADYGK